MKKSTQPTFVILILLIGFIFTSCCPFKSSRLIELNVTANLEVPISDDVSWEFAGQKSKLDSLFTTNVEAGYRVIWVGGSEDALDYYVEITKIVHQSGDNLLTESEIDGYKGVVVADVKKDAPSGIEKYALHFVVYKDGKQIGNPFVIDPKLRIK